MIGSSQSDGRVSESQREHVVQLHTIGDLLEAAPRTLSTGFGPLDEFTGGWHQGDLSLFSDDNDGFSASMFVLQCALAAAHAKERVGIFSATNTTRRVAELLLGICGGPRYYSRSHEYEGAVQLETAKQKLSQLPITISSVRNSDINDVEDALFQMAKKCSLCVIHGAKGIVQSSGSSPGEVLLRLSRFATDLRKPIVCITPKGWHKLVDADLCVRMKIFDKGEYGFNVDVNRHGPTGEFYLRWDLVNFSEFGNETYPQTFPFQNL